jgi:multidrug efflux system outer membrane protein
MKFFSNRLPRKYTNVFVRNDIFRFPITHSCEKLGMTLITTLIAGCSLLGPDYKQPNVETPQNWAHNTHNNIDNAQTNFSDTSWWKKFNDPVLDDMIEQALKNNNNIQVAIGNINVASAQLKQTNMAWVPVIDLGASASTGQALNITGVPPTVNSPPANTYNFNFYNAGLIPAYSLNIMKQIKQSDMAKLNLSANQYAKNAVRLTVISQVVGSYFSLLALHEQLTEQKQLITDLDEGLRLTKLQYADGAATLNDVTQYEMQLQNAKMSIPGIEDNIVHTENALQVLMNKNPGVIVTQNKFANIQTDGKIPGNLPSIVLRNRPDIMQAEEQLKSANVNIGVAYSNYFPTITLTSPLGAFSSQLTNLFYPSGDYWVATAAVSMPILNLGIDQIVKKSKAQYYVAYYNYVQTVKGAFAEVDNNLSSVSKMQNKRIAADKLYASAKLNAKLNETNYELGYSSYPDTISSKVNADTSKMVATGAKLQQLQAIVAAYQAMAGGYNYKNTDLANKFGDDHDI